MKRIRFVLLCLALALAACSGACTGGPAPTAVHDQQPAAGWCTPTHPDTSRPPIALLGGTLIDGTGAAPLQDAALVIQGRCITATGPRSQVPLPADARVIELEGATLLPGMINAHVHNAYNEQNLRAWAQAGVTTVRDLGAPAGYPCFSTRDRLADDPESARVVAAGPIVTVPEGYPIVPNKFPSLAITSPEDARQQIAQLVDEGADVIKIAFSSRPPSLSPQEAAAIVQTAHERGIPVTAHATNPRELRAALNAGVDDVAHISGDRVSDQTIRRMIKGGVYWVPTLEALRGEGGENLIRFVRAGGQVALGTDAGYLAGLEIDMPVGELVLMQEAGMTAMQIIVASTHNAARVCRLDRELGTLEPGKLADVLVVRGNPLEDLQVLRDVRLVIHGGAIIRGE